jgi:hypothetical protein
MECTTRAEADIQHLQVIDIDFVGRCQRYTTTATITHVAFRRFT